MPPTPHADPRARRPSTGRPSFARDPIAWLAWLDAADLHDPATLRVANAPTLWTDAHGCGWRVVATTDGPEIRPSLDHEPIPKTDLPIITAVLVTPYSLTLELRSRQLRMVESVRRGRDALADIGKAMFTGSELPHAGVRRMGADAYRLARRRWDADEQAQASSSSSMAPDAAPVRQNRPVRPVRSS